MKNASEPKHSAPPSISIKELLNRTSISGVGAARNKDDTTDSPATINKPSKGFKL